MSREGKYGGTKAKGYEWKQKVDGGQEREELVESRGGDGDAI